jgi:AAT family amino acid transporter
VTILIFILVGAAVNGGLNEARKAIGFVNWTVGDAPFVGGFGGFANVFVTAALSCEILQFSRSKGWFSFHSDGGTESLGITAGETKDPARNMPRVVKYVFFRYVQVIAQLHSADLQVGSCCSIYFRWSLLD